uniref:PH01B031C15.3 protein n=1 Tax=Phyllostachys edulis TaxID=38705 RepID=L0P264_PHYED|nr:PH01B031C15.3 [Phyllostachys edulis]
MAAAPSRCLLVTGPPFATGFFTPFSCYLFVGEVRESGERVGFEVVTLDGRSGPLASSNISSLESVRWPTVGKYKVDVASLESLALPELQVSSSELSILKGHISSAKLQKRDVKEDTDLFIIDEVGKMELFSSAFFPAVMRVIESNIPVLATIPIPRYGRDIPGVKDGKVAEMTTKMNSKNEHGIT